MYDRCEATKALIECIFKVLVVASLRVSIKSKDVQTTRRAMETQQRTTKRAMRKNRSRLRIHIKWQRKRWRETNEYNRKMHHRGEASCLTRSHLRRTIIISSARSISKGSDDASNRYKHYMRWRETNAVIVDFGAIIQQYRQEGFYVDSTTRCKVPPKRGIDRQRSSSPAKEEKHGGSP